MVGVLTPTTGAGGHGGPSGLPYYSQWESAELVGRFIDGSLRSADDPRWAESGASTPQEYEYWCRKVCGLACLKMILAGRGHPVPPMMRLVEGALACGAFVPDGERVAGLIYKPFTDWVRRDYAISATVQPDLPVEVLAEAA